MPTFQNLPGIVVDLQDGNLAVPPAALGPITLVLGTSGSGPANKLFIVTDPARVETVYDKQGSLLRGMIETLEGGAGTIALYRIGATAAVASGVAHGNTATSGFTITTADADNTAASKLKLSFDAIKDALYIYDVDTDTLVYSDDPENPVNLNRAYVSGEAAATAADIGMRQDSGLSVTAGQKTIVITGDVTDFYSQGDIISVSTSSTTDKSNEGDYRIGSVVFSVNTTITFNAKIGTPGWTGWSITESSAITLRHQIPITLEAIGNDNTLITPESFACTIAGTTVTSAAIVSDGIADEDLVWLEAEVASESGFYYLPAAAVGNTFSLALTTPDGTGVNFTSTTGTLYDAGKVSGSNIVIREDITTAGSTNTKLFVGQRIYIYSDVISERGYYWVKTASFAANYTTVTVTATSDTSGTAVTFTSTKARVFDLIAWNFVQGTDGLDLDYRGLYEALGKAYNELETANVDMIVPMDVYLDVPNVADNNTLSHTDNALLWQKKEVVNGELIYTWLDQTELDALEISNPDDAAKYHEVNFAYQLANFCWNLDRNEHSCLGVIGVLPPTGFSKSQLSSWYGTLPTYNLQGNIVADGTGLLGNKFRVGNLTRDPGFFATSSEELDGVPLKDDNNKNIDIGKYLSISSTPAVLRNAFLGGGGYIASFAPTYGGLVIALPPNVAPTNQFTKPSAVVPFALPKSVINDLVGAGYVVLGQSATGQTKVIDAPTAATSASDYQRLMTVRVVADIVQSAREIAEPYIGKIVNAAIRDALSAQINRMLGQKQQLNLLNRGSFAEVRATRAQEIKGEADLRMTLVVSLELRRIRVVVGLSK